MNPGSRPKVTGDTFFLPDPEGAVYFRNNSGSFRMEGSMMDRWIEHLMPVFNGAHSLEELTGGLPDAHRSRVYEIAESLYRNGFIRDVSQDLPHSLTNTVLDKFASQIDFLDSFGGSGAYRFQKFREAKMLAAGGGPMLVSLVSGLLDAGYPNIRFLVTGERPTDRKRVGELAAYARLTDPAVRVEELAAKGDRGIPWHEAIRPFDWILYVKQGDDAEELLAVDEACRDEGKTLIPAVVLRQAGIAGPVARPETGGRWKSAWRRLHRPAISLDPQLHTVSSTAEGMLANLIVFEFLKAASGAEAFEPRHELFLLNLETLEGSRHSFQPHPSATGRLPVQWKEITYRPTALPPASDGMETSEWLSGFNRLTSPVTGILHEWGEGEYKQLPLALCRVQAADPLSEGPADLLPAILCGGFTHEEARREAGLAGIESYAARLTELPDSMGVGTGQSASEAVCRALYQCLKQKLEELSWTSPPPLSSYDALGMEDLRNDYYLTSITTMKGTPLIGTGNEISGFPVMWVGCAGSWFGGIGFDRTMALQNALVQAVMTTQCGDVDQAAIKFQPALAESDYDGLLESAFAVLKRQGKRAAVYDLAVEPFMKEQLAGVYGVALCEEETP